MTLVRGSKDRLRLDWQGGFADGPDGTRYMIQTETIRHEGTSHYAVITRSGGNPGRGHVSHGCPYGEEASVRDQKKLCEWDAWDRAGRPSA